MTEVRNAVILFVALCVGLATGYFIRGMQTNDTLVRLAAQATQEKINAIARFQQLSGEVQKALATNQLSEDGFK
jgi:hypothetical protein